MFLLEELGGVGQAKSGLPHRFSLLAAKYLVYLSRLFFIETSILIDPLLTHFLKTLLGLDLLFSFKILYKTCKKGLLRLETKTTGVRDSPSSAQVLDLSSSAISHSCSFQSDSWQIVAYWMLLDCLVSQIRGWGMQSEHRRDRHGQRRVFNQPHAHQ